MTKVIRLLILVLPLIVLAGCEKEPEARGTVLEFVRALRVDEDFPLEDYLDIDELIRENAENVYIYDSTLSISENKDAFKVLFERQGKLRLLWTSKRIVIGKAIERGDTALVEVTFIDDNIRNYNQFGLKKAESGWKIFAFKLL